MPAHVVLRHLILAIVVCGVSATETCDGSGYRQCKNIGHNPGCCGEGWDYSFIVCNKCSTGKYRAWIDGRSTKYTTASNAGLMGHWCQDCPGNTYQPKKGCRSCEACNGEVVNKRTECCAKSVGFVRDGNCVACEAWNSMDQGRLCMKKEESEYELENCHFSVSVLDADSNSACRPGFNVGGKACKTKPRVTFALIPSHWVARFLNREHTDKKCTSLTRTTFNAPAGTNCEGYNCEKQPSDSCFVNKNSFGLVICDVLDKCYTITEIKKLLEDRFDQASLNSIWGPDIYKSKKQHLVVRMPYDEVLGLQLNIFQNDVCTEPQQAYISNPKIRDEFEGEATLLDLDGSPGVRNSFFKITSNLKCACPPGHGGELLNMGLGMFQQCRVCKSSERLASVISSNPCNKKTKECRSCAHNYHGSEDKSECIACIDTDPEKPFRPNMPREDSCRACYWNEAWTGHSCTLMFNISIIDGTILRDFDQYRIAPLSAAERVPQGFYRYRSPNETGIFDTSRIEPCLHRARVCERYREYLHACTGDISNTAIFYVKTPEQNSAPMLWEEYMSASGEKGPVDIVRDGVCQACSTCSNGEFLEGCLYTESSPPFSIWPGAHYESQDQNTGTCMSCEGPRKDSEYYDHPQQTIGCRDWPNTVVTKPYDVKPCVDVEYRRSINVKASTVVLLVGCGEKSFPYWNAIESDSIGSRSVPATTQCNYGEDCFVPRASGVSYELLQWSKYKRYTVEIPYCPRGWHVDEVCVQKTLEDDPIDVTWNPACCLRCGDCDFVYNKRGAGWSTCPGSTVTDTQLICTDTCDFGYYEFVQLIDGRNISTCQECETCQ